MHSDGFSHPLLKSTGMKNKYLLYLLFFMSSLLSTWQPAIARTVSFGDSLQLNIRGMVKDENGKPLSFISIRNSEKGWTVLSDEKGQFSFQIQKEEVLVFSGPGLENRQIKIMDGRDQQVIMIQKEEIGMIEESGSKTLVKGLVERKELDSLYANDIIISRDIEVPDSLMGFSVFPVRITGEGLVRLGIQLIPDGEYSVSLTNNEGKELTHEKIKITRAEKNYSIKIAKWPPGSYYLILNLGKSKYLRQKLIICK